MCDMRVRYLGRVCTCGNHGAKDELGKWVAVTQVSQGLVVRIKLQPCLVLCLTVRRLSSMQSPLVAVV